MAWGLMGCRWRDVWKKLHAGRSVQWGFFSPRWQRWTQRWGCSPLPPPHTQQAHQRDTGKNWASPSVTYLVHLPSWLSDANPANGNNKKSQKRCSVTRLWNRGHVQHLIPGQMTDQMLEANCFCSIVFWNEQMQVQCVCRSRSNYIDLHFVIFLRKNFTDLLLRQENGFMYFMSKTAAGNLTCMQVWAQPSWRCLCRFCLEIYFLKTLWPLPKG